MRVWSYGCVYRIRRIQCAHVRFISALAWRLHAEAEACARLALAYCCVVLGGGCDAWQVMKPGLYRWPLVLRLASQDMASKV